MRPGSLASTDAHEPQADGNAGEAAGTDDWGANAQQAMRLAQQWTQTPAAQESAAVICAGRVGQKITSRDLVVGQFDEKHPPGALEQHQVSYTQERFYE